MLTPKLIRISQKNAGDRLEWLTSAFACSSGALNAAMYLGTSYLLLTAATASFQYVTELMRSSVSRVK